MATGPSPANGAAAAPSKPHSVVPAALAANDSRFPAFTAAAATLPIASLVASGDRERSGATPADSARLPAPTSPTGLAASAGGPAGGGSSPNLFLALLSAFAAFACLLRGRLLPPSVAWRSTPFIALLERPG